MFVPGEKAIADDTLCASVKIQITQELTLERQAFDAHMRINNGLTNISLEDVNVDVWFTDEDGETVLASSDSSSTDALFFITLDTMENIDDVSGSGSVDPDTSADIHWLIIPAPGASNGLESGTLYYVGATLTYTLGGEENETTVSPDYIYVKPMPELVLDYFLPEEVYGDDPTTTEIEAEVPFSLGVRVKNEGFGNAVDLQIDSAQPKIVENEQGLLIGFIIDGSEVNGEAATDSLLVDFGTIAPNASGVARWIMRCSLYGRFVSFDATFSHSDELGGELTSLINSVDTHTLVQDVLVDVSGRDEIEDFLAKDDDVYRVYESESQETEVTVQSDSATLELESQSGTEDYYTLTAPVTAGFMFVKLTDPLGGEKILESVIRSDGKTIKSQNAWLSKTKDKETQTWDYYVNLFDANTTDSYTLVFEDSANVAQAPNLQYVADKSIIEEETISFLVEASDPNGTVPTLSASPLPVGADFYYYDDGVSIFEWTPSVGQQGTYSITYTASDGELSTSRTATITVYDIGDTDMDGMLDSWEMTYFGTLDRDGTGDYDGDGISDLQEFLDGTDPTLDESAPSTPDPLYPYENEDVTELTPELVVENSTDAQGDDISYEFEIYSDEQMTELVASDETVAALQGKDFLPIYHWYADFSLDELPDGVEVTTWPVPDSLADNSWYYWRVRSTDGEASSLWAYWEFFVNTENDPPDSFYISSPSDGIEVDVLTPELVVTNSEDIDRNVLTYSFEIYEDEEMTTLAASVSDVTEGADGATSWTVSTALNDGTWYYWRAVVVDEFGEETESDLSSFYVNTANYAPSAPIIASPADSVEVDADEATLTVENAEDDDGDALEYIFEIDTVQTFDSADKQTSEAISEGSETTGWLVEDLEEDTQYYWRAKATDGGAEGPWTQSGFFINQINDSPSVPNMKNPGVDAWVNTLTPVLSVHPATDSDGDTLYYVFEIYSNEALTHFVVQEESENTDWTVSKELTNNTWYYWRVQSLDEHGVTSAWSDVSAFFVKIDITNESPELTFSEPSDDVVTNDETLSILWDDEDADSSALIALYYDTDTEGEDGVLIAGDIEEDLDDTQDTYSWDISQMEEGTWYIYAVIDDGTESLTVYNPAAITIDRTAPVLTIEPDEGTYEEAQTITVATDEAADIHYTLDGNDPDENSTVYTEAIEIAENTIFKVIAIDEAGNISAVETRTYTIGEEEIILTVVTDGGDPLEGLKVYVYTEAGSCTGVYAVTDSEGKVVFDPDDFESGSYMFRAGYLGSYFWSDTLLFPETLLSALVIPVESTTVTVATANGPVEGVRVYLYSESGSCLGWYLLTDENGQVIFDLPEGMAFIFRADILGTKYYSDTVTVADGGVNLVSVDAGGGLLQVTLQKDADTPISDIKLYLYSDQESYLGEYQVTDDAGQVAFEVPEAAYKIRATYLGYKFWTDSIDVTTDTSVDFTLPHKEVAISVNGVFQDESDPITDVKVYLFNTSDSYVSWYEVTDEYGMVYFSLPEDQAYKVRITYLGSQFWSDEFTGEDASVDISMADVLVTVAGGGVPKEDVKVYLYSSEESYLGKYDTTDTDGQATFRIPEGTYKFRADYLGNQYWSADADLAADVVNDVEVSVGGGSFTFTLLKDDGTPIEGSKCYTYNEAGNCTGLYGVTNEDGQVFFDLGDGNYQFKVKYMGEEFWSDTASVPDAMSMEMTLSHETTEVTVSTTNAAVEGAKVYLYSEEESYLGSYEVTDENGMVSFDLPVGVVFKFKAYVMKNEYWSDAVEIVSGATNYIGIDAGGGLLAVTLLTDADDVLTDIKLLLFNSDDVYLGTYQSTDDLGQVFFEVPEADFKVRADYLGYQFWTDTFYVDADMALDFVIPHTDVTVTVDGRYQEEDTPVEGIRAYLYNATGNYLGTYQQTDENGQVVFSLPERGYMVRADYMGENFWSETFAWDDADIIIPMADADVIITGAGLPASDIRVCVYSASESYLSLYGFTDEEGGVSFRIPAGEYLFRAYYQGSYFWSAGETLLADQANDVIISTGGGSFGLNVLKTTDDPLAGLKVYVFNDSDSYVGVLGATDDNGQATFDLADGSYKFRISYLGYKFWTDVFTVPDTLEETFLIPHDDITVTLTGTYLEASPLADIYAYLFADTDSYAGEKLATDENGQAVFSLPDQPYMIRASYMGEKYWTESFQSEDVSLDIPHGLVSVHVTDDESDVASAKVYVFNEDETYLGTYDRTDDTGLVDFQLPADRSYLFRVDVDGQQAWSGAVDIIAGEATSVEVLLD
jgi:hypothetical protein